MDPSPVPRPELSIAVVPFGGVEALAGCLDALAAQSGAGRLEVVVPGDDRHDFAELEARHPAFRFAPLKGRRTWAELRQAAVRRCHAPIVALTEAQCVPAADWAARVLEAHRSSGGSSTGSAGHAAIGGAVDKAEGGIVGWAMYFSDYARYAPPLEAGPATALTDCNVSYKRRDLDAVASSWDGEFHEPTVHAALAEAGRGLWLDPAIRVLHGRAPSLAEATRDRFRFGRLFGATRAAHVSSSRRWLLAAAAPLVPGLIAGRAGYHAASKRRHLDRLALALPVMALLAIVWGLGELVGTVTGDAGPLAPGSAREAGG